jgi:hypothetical protein
MQHADGPRHPAPCLIGPQAPSPLPRGAHSIRRCICISQKHYIITSHYITTSHIAHRISNANEIKTQNTNDSQGARRKANTSKQGAPHWLTQRAWRMAGGMADGRGRGRAFGGCSGEWEAADVVVYTIRWPGQAPAQQCGYKGQRSPALPRGPPALALYSAVCCRMSVLCSLGRLPLCFWRSAPRRGCGHRHPSGLHIPPRTQKKDANLQYFLGLNRLG